jgi:hypothetical protein
MISGGDSLSSHMWNLLDHLLRRRIEGRRRDRNRHDRNKPSARRQGLAQSRRHQIAGQGIGYYIRPDWLARRRAAGLPRAARQIQSILSFPGPADGRLQRRTQLLQARTCKCLLRMHEIAGPDLLLTQEFLAIWACDDPASLPGSVAHQTYDRTLKLSGSPRRPSVPYVETKRSATMRERVRSRNAASARQSSTARPVRSQAKHQTERSR